MCERCRQACISSKKPTVKSVKSYRSWQGADSAATHEGTNCINCLPAMFTEYWVNFYWGQRQQDLHHVFRQNTSGTSVASNVLLFEKHSSKSSLVVLPPKNRVPSPQGPRPAGLFRPSDQLGAPAAFPGRPSMTGLKLSPVGIEQWCVDICSRVPGRRHPSHQWHDMILCMCIVYGIWYTRDMYVHLVVACAFLNHEPCLRKGISSSHIP